MEANIRKGSVVTIKDGSYMKRKIGRNYIGDYTQDNTPIGHSRDLFEVRDVNVRLPISKSSMSDVLGYQNNCIIKNKRTGEIWACSRINIKNTETI